MAQAHQRLRDAFSPDFVHYNDSETRTGGFEPYVQAYPSTAAAFAAQVRRQVDRIVAGYCEEAVAENRRAWERATDGYEDGLVGSMFYTSLDGYQDLDTFGAEWW